MLAYADDIARNRGTAMGIRRVLQVCAGVKAKVNSSPTPNTFHIVVKFPKGNEVKPQFIHELIMAHKPASMGYSLEIEVEK
jgi:hypothetical protein